MKTWKVGIVGTGYWSEKHLQAWSRVSNVEIAALCNRSPEKMLKKASAYNIPEQNCYRSIDDMLKQADIDIVDIVTGPETHLEMVTKASEAGKHILCQKPFANNTLKEAEQMVEKAKHAGVRLMVTENWRWLSRFQTMKNILNEGRLGAVKVARYIHTDYYTPRMTPGVDLPQPFFREMPRLLFYEMGVHWYDTWRFLFGTPKRLYAELQRVSPHIKGEDSGIVTLGYDEFYGYMDMSWATRQKLDLPLGTDVGPVHLEQFVIDGTEGSLKMYTNGHIAIVSKDGSIEEKVLEGGPLDHDDSHARLSQHFIDCLESGESFQTSGEDNLVTLKMAFGTYESAEQHKVIKLKN